MVKFWVNIWPVSFDCELDFSLLKLPFFEKFWANFGDAEKLVYEKINYYIKFFGEDRFDVIFSPLFLPSHVEAEIRFVHRTKAT